MLHYSGEGVNELFSHLAREALHQHQLQEQQLQESGQSGQSSGGSNIRVRSFLCYFNYVLLCYMMCDIIIGILS